MVDDRRGSGSTIELRFGAVPAPKTHGGTGDGKDHERIRNAALEEAAKACDEAVVRAKDLAANCSGEHQLRFTIAAKTAENCAEAIRALKTS